ncbi:MAG TPA: energy transducer TonB [Arenimonas sp.]|uniref:energy transducer TonB n=1 Tax=Arenimonas sp. TaxID=1872635 RepID=UPI002BBF3403|nr:energy transducer TonB [Arenimonas sp.]HMB56993.1 energy transducer TonB [Arenimonas sp.]
MSSTPAPPATGPRPGPTIGPSERLSATLALSLICFGVLILGIGFSRDDAAPVVPTLDVILTQTSTPDAPKHADFIAQANNQGGGDSDTSQRPRDDQVGQVPKPQPGVAPQPMPAQAPPPAPDPLQRMVTTVGASAVRVPNPEEQPSSDPAPLPTGRQLMQQSLEMARLAAEIERRQALYAKRPKRKFISASTQQYEYASYMRAWVEKVERVGNLNYPELARRQNLSGRLVMTVVIRRDGNVGGITIVTPSGVKVLDQAAARTVRLAEPFPPLPKTAESVDELYITRTWDFKNGSVDSEQ